MKPLEFLNDISVAVTKKQIIVFNFSLTFFLTLICERQQTVTGVSSLQYQVPLPDAMC